MELDIAQLLAAVGTTLLAVVTVWKSLKSGARENRLLDADAADKYEDIAARTGARNEVLIERLHKLEDKIECIEHEISVQRKALKAMRAGVLLLVAQLEEADITPIWSPEPLC
jgi:hypothetical protein